MIEYDRLGYWPSALTLPGGTVKRLERDAVGRPAKLTLNDGARLIETETIFDPSGLVVTRRSTAWLLAHGSGVLQASKAERSSSLFYDAQKPLEPRQTSRRQ